MADSKAPTSKLLELIRTGKPTSVVSEEKSDKEKTPTKKKKEAKQHKPEDNISTEKKSVKISKNFHKVPNIVCDNICADLSMPEEIVYMHMIRHSWGWNRNWCQIGTNYFLVHSSIKSRKAVKDAIKKLLDRRLIKLSMKDGKIERNNNGTIYIVLIPEAKSILYNSILEKSTLKDSILDNSIRGLGNSILGNSTQDVKAHENDDQEGVLSNSILPNSQIKDIFKDNLKDTLSKETLINKFYECLGQSKITKKKRERGINCLEELQSEGYSLEDISFAIEWTVKNTDKKLYDFSILEHTINQAMAAKGKAERQEAERIDQERIEKEKKIEEEKTKAEADRLEKYKETLNKKERNALRNKALEKIKQDGCKESLITEALISVFENELLSGK